MLQLVAPNKLDQFPDLLRQVIPVWHATDPTWDVVALSEGIRLDLAGWTGATFYSPDDMVASFRSGTRISEVQQTLGTQGQFLPLGEMPLGDPDPDLATAIGFALPHTLEGPYGSWREWILGMTVMLGDGTIAKSGAKVVKSVAGYDAHKLFVGARGTLGVILEVTLRVWPCAEQVRNSARPTEATGRPWIQRTLRTDFESAIESNQGAIVALDEATATLWGRGDPPKRFPSDWLLQGKPGELEFTADEIPFLQKAKRLLDPDGKLNPGGLGIF